MRRSVRRRGRRSRREHTETSIFPTETILDELLHEGLFPELRVSRDLPLFAEGFELWHSELGKDSLSICALSWTMWYGAICYHGVRRTGMFLVAKGCGRAKLAFEEQFEQSRETAAGTDPPFRTLSVQQRLMQGGEVVEGDDGSRLTRTVELRPLASRCDVVTTSRDITFAPGHSQSRVFGDGHHRFPLPLQFVFIEDKMRRVSLKQRNV